MAPFQEKITFDKFIRYSVVTVIFFLLYLLMSPFQEKITFDKFIRYSVVTVIFFLLYLLMRRLSNVLMPFFVAWFLAYLLHPVVCFFQYKCKLKKRILSILVTLLLIGLVLWLFYLLIVPPAAAEIERVKNLVTAY